MSIACVYIPRFMVEAERQRRKEIGSRLVLIGDARVLDCSLGAKAVGIRAGMGRSDAIALSASAGVSPRVCAP